MANLYVHLEFPEIIFNLISFDKILRIWSVIILLLKFQPFNKHYKHISIIIHESFESNVETICSIYEYSCFGIKVSKMKSTILQIVIKSSIARIRVYIAIMILQPKSKLLHN